MICNIHNCNRYFHCQIILPYSFFVDGFNPALEVKIDDKVLEWLTLPEVLAMAKEAEETFQAASFWTEQTPTSRTPVVRTATGRSGQE